MTVLSTLVTVMVWVSLVFAALPVMMLLGNKSVFAKATKPRDEDNETPKVSLLIPARDEAGGIEACIRAALASEQVDLEIVVLDDHSTDDTAAIVRRLSHEDSRVRLAQSASLPEGWCGKQHACWQLSKHARHDVLMFIDADVKLTSDALIRAVTFLSESGAGLVSGFPFQRTRSLGEILTVSQIMLLLCGYLPMARMRASAQPGLGAGCGQWFIARRDAYEQVGGHEQVRSSLHDGVKLPRAFRAAGVMTDMFDASDVATCRMYRGFGESWRGFAKNATEGMAGPIGIWVWTALLGFGHVLPWVWLFVWLSGGMAGLSQWTQIAALVSCFLAFTASVITAAWFRQGVLAALLRPFGVTVMLAIQWYAWVRQRLGRPVGWRGRAYGESA